MVNRESGQISTEPVVYPLSCIPVGSSVRVRQLLAEGPLTQRLREMGLCENQTLRLIDNQSTMICLVGNMRLAISAQLAALILVEPSALTQAA